MAYIKRYGRRPFSFLEINMSSESESSGENEVLQFLQTDNSQQVTLQKLKVQFKSCFIKDNKRCKAVVEFQDEEQIKLIQDVYESSSQQFKNDYQNAELDIKPPFLKTDPKCMEISFPSSKAILVEKPLGFRCNYELFNRIVESAILANNKKALEQMKETRIIDLKLIPWAFESGPPTKRVVRCGGTFQLIGLDSVPGNFYE